MAYRYLATLVALICLSGCASNRNAEEERLNNLWKEGYGFNNPNPDRIKNGQKPLNFNGSK
jgi:hypothetical protein